MKIKIWTMTTDTDDGLQTQLFTIEAARNAAVFDWLALDEFDSGRTGADIEKEFDGDMILAGKKYQNGEDFLNFDDHEIEVPIADGEIHLPSVITAEDWKAIELEHRDKVERRKLHVKVEVTGGNAHVTQCPKGVTVEIVDHDNERNG